MSKGGRIEMIKGMLEIEYERKNGKKNNMINSTNGGCWSKSSLYDSIGHSNENNNRNKNIRVLINYYWSTFLVCAAFIIFSSCARGCGCGKKIAPETQEQEIKELNFAGVVGDEEGKPVESAFVSVKIDINGDQIFSPDETFSTMTNKDGFFFIGSEMITARLSQSGSGMITGRMITGRIITGRIQVDVYKDGFAKNSFHIDGPGFSDVKLAKASSAKDSDLKDGAQFALVSSVITARSPILLADKKAKNARIFAKQEGGEVIAEINIPPELVSEYKELSASVAFVNPASNPELMPGSFLAYQPGSEKGFITLSSAGLLSVNISNEKGEIVSTFAPKIARIKKKQQDVNKPSLMMKIPEDVHHTLYDYVEETTDKVEVPMWYYDDVKGVWIQGEELGVLQDEDGKLITPRQLAKIVLGKETKKLYVSAKVEHFSEWNVDYPVDTHAAVTGQVVDQNGNPISGLFVQTEGNTYGGAGDWKGAYTDSGGNFTVDVKKSNPVHDKPSEGKTRGPYDDYLNDIGNKLPTSPDGGGGIDCDDIKDKYKDILLGDIQAFDDAIFELWQKRIIDESTWRVYATALNRAKANLDIYGDFKYAINAINNVQKGLEPVGRSSADQIFYERWESIGNEAKGMIVSFIVDKIYGKIYEGIFNHVGDIISNCGKAAIGSINEFLGLGIYKDAVNTAVSASVKGEDISTAFLSQFTEPDAVVGNILSKTAGILTSEDTLECLGQSVPEIGGVIKEVAGTAYAGWLFVAQTVGTFASQAIQAWGEHQEWKSAKAWEEVQPLINRFRKDYGEFLRAQKTIPTQCKEILSPYLPFPPTAAPKFQYSYKQNTLESPRVQPKQASETFPSDSYADDATSFLNMLSSFAHLIFGMDKVVKGGTSYFGERLWAVKCSFLQDKKYYICSNSENPMDCSFSSELSHYVCTPKSDEKVQYVETSSRIIAYTQAPKIRYGGETRSKILIEGKALDLKTSLGFNLLDIPSPVESSTSHHELYGWSEEARKPYIYIGKIVLPVKSLKIKGKCVDKAKKPIPDLRIYVSYGKIWEYISTLQDGTFSVSIWDFEGEGRNLSVYIPQYSYSKDISLSDLKSDEVDLGEIVLVEPIRITNLSIPRDVKRNDKVKLSVSYVGGTNPKVQWFSVSKEIDQGDNIDFTFTKSTYICVRVSDDFSYALQCDFVRVISQNPSISIFANGQELKENVDYEFDEKTYVPFEVKVSDPDSPPETLRVSSEVDYNNNYSFSLSNSYSFSPVLYTGRVNQDTISSINFGVCDDDWNCVSKQIKIKVKNKPITPYIKIYPEKLSGHAPLELGIRINAKDYIGYISLDTNGDGKEDTKAYSDYVVVELKEQGKFKITAKVKSEDDIEASDSVDIDVFPEFKILSFSADKTQVKRKEVVRFEATASSQPIKYRWIFGDSLGIETAQNSVTYSYNPRFAGTYYTKVAIITYIGEEIVSQPIAIQVLNSFPRILSFSPSATSGVAPFDVTFSVIAEDDFEVSRYFWDFGDGYKQETTSASVTHRYSAAGEYTAQVTIYDSDGDTDTKTLRISILAQPTCDTPQVSLYANPTSGNSPLIVTFQANVTSLFPISEYRWDFNNDGTIDYTTTTTNTVQKTYTSYYSTQVTAKVTVVNQCGNSNYATVQIQIVLGRQYHSSDYFTPVSTCFLIGSTSTFDFMNEDSFEVSDVNGDSKADIVISSLPKNSFFVFHGNGAGSYSFSTSYSAPSGHSIDYVLYVDSFDSDTAKDVVLSGGTGTQHYLYFYKNNGSSFASPVSSYIDLGSEHCVAFDMRSADVNQDGKRDIFVGCSGTSFLAYGNADGSFSPVVTFPEITGWVRRAKLVDLDRDGKLDIVGVNLQGKYFFAKRQTSSGFDLAVTFPLPNSITPASLDTADFDGDGKDEIVVISDDQILYRYKNQSLPGSLTTSSFSLQSTANAQIINPLSSISLQLSEMNSDGTPDIIWTASLYSGGATHFNLSFGDPNTISTSSGFPREVSSYFSGLPFNFGPIGLPDIEVSDVNSDGFSDVVLAYIQGGNQFCIVSFIRKTTSSSPPFVLKDNYQHQLKDRVSGGAGCSASERIVIYYFVAFVSLFFILKARKKRGYS